MRCVCRGKCFDEGLFAKHRNGNIALRVEIEQQHLLALPSKGICEVPRDRRLSDPSLVVEDRYRLSHESPGRQSVEARSEMSLGLGEN